MHRAGAACTSLFLGGAEGIVKLLLLRDQKDLRNSPVEFHVVTRHLGP